MPSLDEYEADQIAFEDTHNTSYVDLMGAYKRTLAMHDERMWQNRFDPNPTRAIGAPSTFFADFL